MQSDPSIPTDLVGSDAGPLVVGGTPFPPDPAELRPTVDTGETVGEFPASDDPWAWAHEEPDRTEPMLDPANVAALMVVHNAEAWLPRTLQSLSRLDPRPGLTVAVDTGSTDRTAELLRQAADEGVFDRIVELPAATPFAEAVNRARDEARGEDNAWLDTPGGWLWLLHDDCEPTRSALGQLLVVAATSPSPDIVVPALLRPRRRNYPDQLQEVGQTVSLTGSRLTGTDPGEIDQHQLESDEVLGGASAGLLVRTEIFDRVGGFDPRLQHREGVDLAWRARDTGARVVTAPRATIHHRQAGLAGTRDGVSDPDPESTDRLSGMRLVAARSPRPRLAMAGLVLVGLLRGLGLIIGRAPGRALAEWRAALALVRSRAVVRELAGGREASGAVSEALRPHFLGTMVGGIGAAAASIGSRVIDWRASDTSLDELTGDDFAGAPSQVSIWRPSMVWGVLTVVGLIAAIRLIGGDIVSTRLLPSPSFSGIWDAWWRPTPGVAGAPAPWLGFAAVGSTLALGRPGLWIWLVLALAVVITARGASTLLREIAEAPAWLIVALSALWALLLPWLGILQRGDVGVLAIVATAPWMGLALWRWATSELAGPAAWRAPAAVGLLGLLWFSVQPISWLLVVGGVVLVLLGRPHTWRAAVPALVAPLIFAAGWMPRLAQAPARLLVPSDPLAGSDTARGGPLALLGIVSTVPALPTWLVLAVGIVLWVGLLALLIAGARDAGRLDLLTGALAVVALLVGAFLPRVPVSMGGHGLHVDAAAFIAVGLGTLMALGYRLYVMRTVDQVDPAGDVDSVAPVALGRRRGTRATILVAGVLSLVIATGWVVLGDRPAHRAPSVLPSWVTELQSSPRAGRTLLVDLTASPVTWQLSDAHRPQWGSAEQSGALSGQAGGDLRDLVVSVASGRPLDSLASRLSDAGVVAVWVHGDNGVLSGVPGLQSTPQDSTTTVYAVTGLVSRLSIVDGTTTTPIGDATVAASPNDRTLVLAEPTDSRWRARVGDTGLPQADPGDGWQQRFTLPAGVQGTLQWGMAPAVGSVVIEVLVLVVLLVLVAPVAAPSGASPKRAALGPSQRRGVSGG